MLTGIGRWVIVLIAGLASATPRVAGAIGHYVPGIPNSRDYFVPPPGLYLLNYTYWYHSETFRDRNGNSIEQVTVPVPGVGPRTFNLDTTLNQVAVLPMLAWSPDWEWNGVRWGAYVAQGFANTSLNAAVNDIDRGFDVATSWGATDLFFQPLWLQWSSQHLDAVVAYGFYAPTGRFEPGALDNTGLGYWEHQVQTATAFHFDQKKTLSLVMVGTWELNQDIQGVDVHPGSRFTFNWAFSKIWLEGMLESALVGYDTWQMSANSGADVPAFRAGVIDEVHAAGLQLGIPKLGLHLHYLHEFRARARFQGQMLTLTFTLPIPQLIEGIGSAFE